MEMAEVLVSLHENVAHNSQIEEWRADLSAFDKEKTELEEEVSCLRDQAYQEVTWYSVFQGVIFTTVSHANLIPCQLWWGPASVSIALSFVIFVVIASKLYGIGDLKEEIKETDCNIAAIVYCLDKVNTEGRCALDLEPVRRLQDKRDADAGYRYIRSKYGISVLAFLTIFSFLIAYFDITALFRHCAPCLSSPPSP